MELLRSNRRFLFKKQPPEVFCKKGVLRNFTKFTGKYLCQRLFFNKVAGLRPATLLKNESLNQLFSCEFCKISKTPILQNTSGRLLLSFGVNEKLLVRNFVNIGNADLNFYFTSAKSYLPPFSNEIQRNFFLILHLSRITIFHVNAVE